MRALVIGGAGFVGAAACRELMRRGVETVAAGRTPRPYGTFTSYEVLDRSDLAELAAVLARVSPDVVLDLAAYHPADVRRLLDVFGGDRYVFVSSGVYPDEFPRPGEPAIEADFVPLEGAVPDEPLSYFEGKRWCETVLAREAGRDWVVVRPPAILGAGDRTLRVAAYIERLADGGPLLVPEESYRRQAGLAWVRDVGHVCALACERPNARGPYNVAFDGLSLAGLIEGLASGLGVTAELVPVPYAELPEGASPYGPDPRRSAGYILDRARAELGFVPSAPAEALAETLAWYRAESPSHPGYSGRARELELAAFGGRRADRREGRPSSPC